MIIIVVIDLNKFWFLVQGRNRPRERELGRRDSCRGSWTLFDWSAFAFVWRKADQGSNAGDRPMIRTPPVIPYTSACPILPFLCLLLQPSRLPPKTWTSLCIICRADEVSLTRVEVKTRWWSGALASCRVNAL